MGNYDIKDVIVVEFGNSDKKVSLIRTMVPKDQTTHTVFMVFNRLIEKVMETQAGVSYVDKIKLHINNSLNDIRYSTTNGVMIPKSIFDRLSFRPIEVIESSNTILKYSMYIYKIGKQNDSLEYSNTATYIFELLNGKIFMDCVKTTEKWKFHNLVIDYPILYKTPWNKPIWEYLKDTPEYVGDKIFICKKGIAYAYYEELDNWVAINDNILRNLNHVKFLKQHHKEEFQMYFNLR